MFTLQRAEPSVHLIGSLDSKRNRSDLIGQIPGITTRNSNESGELLVGVNQTLQFVDQVYTISSSIPYRRSGQSHLSR